MEKRIGFLKTVVTLGFSLISTVASASSVPLFESPEALRAIDFSKDKVILIGETDHYDKTLLQIEIDILKAIEASTPLKRKCLLFEAEPQFDEAFQVYSKSTSKESLAHANSLLDAAGEMGSQIAWLGETYQTSLFEFAEQNGWTIRSGDMFRGEAYREKVREGNVSEEWLTYHEIQLRNEFMASRVEELGKTDCDLVVGLYGSTHLTQVKNLPTFKARNVPVPTLLARKKIRSNTVLAVNPTLLKHYYGGMRDRSVKIPGYRKPEALVAY